MIVPTMVMVLARQSRISGTFAILKKKAKRTTATSNSPQNPPGSVSSVSTSQRSPVLRTAVRSRSPSLAE